MLPLGRLLKGREDIVYDIVVQFLPETIPQTLLFSLWKAQFQDIKLLEGCWKPSIPPAGQSLSPNQARPSKNHVLRAHRFELL